MKFATVASRRFLGLIILLASLTAVRADAPATFTVGEFTFTRPAKFEWVEVTSEMRKAQLKVSDPDTKAVAEIVFFQFGPGAAGGVQANVDRWMRQFAEPRDQIHAAKEEVTVGKTKITYASAEGTYKSGMPGSTLTPMPDYALQGAIIDSDDGAVFVRMTGPKALVKASTDDFKKMVESGPKKN
ncbi:MAG TPA: hypothetical protein VH413_07440 [Verrucomicrobiae bacterium]|jgi:hypothetical protein|nr:hypothetical protein [Verrucomicrobiae bacterium]